LKKVYALTLTMDAEHRLKVAGLALQRGQYREAELQLNKVLDENWLHSNANLLMGILKDLLGRPQLSRKYFAIAKVKRLRDLGKLPQKSGLPNNYRTMPIDLRFESIDYKVQKTQDEQLEDSQCDQLFFELAELLLENSSFDSADLAIQYIKDQRSPRFLMVLARVRVSQGRHLEAVTALDDLLA